MKIVSLKWRSQEAKEAELIISDGKHECLSFSHPCRVTQGQIYNKPLYAVDVENLMDIGREKSEERIEKTSDHYFSYYCIGKIIKIKESTIKIGEILINLDIPIPGWAHEGDLVEFKCARLDIW